MQVYELPALFEPDFWNVMFYPSDSAATRILLGRFRHVCAFGYAAGFRAWIVYDVQWGRLQLGLYSHPGMLDFYRRAAKHCTVVKVERRPSRFSVRARLGFYCVPAIKHLLGLSCVAVTPDGLYRHLINNGGIIINGSAVRTTTTAAGSATAAGTAAGPG